MFKTIIENIRDRGNGSSNYREVIYFANGLSHATPIIYIKEQNLSFEENPKELILYADSKGNNNFIVDELGKFCETMNIEVFTLEGIRQADHNSCFSRLYILVKKQQEKIVMVNILFLIFYIFNNLFRKSRR